MSKRRYLVMLWAARLGCLCWLALIAMYLLREQTESFWVLAVYGFLAGSTMQDCIQAWFKVERFSEDVVDG